MFRRVTAEPTDIEERILDAARDVFAELGVRKTRMGHVAEAAGCARATLYRYFETKEALVAAYAVRELGRASRLVVERVSRLTRLGDRLTEALAASIEIVRDTPAIRPFLDPDAQGLTFSLPSHAPSMGPPLLATLLSVVADHDGTERLREDLPAGELLEWCVRLVLSLALVPGPERGPRALRGLLGRLVRPAFVVDAEA